LKRTLLAKTLVMSSHVGVAAAPLTSANGSVASSTTISGVSHLALLAAKGAALGALVVAGLHGIEQFGSPSSAVPPASALPVRPTIRNEAAEAARTRHGAAIVPGGAPEISALPSTLAARNPAAPPAAVSTPLPASSSAEEDSLERELELMAEVQGALRDGRSELALELVQRHAAAFPNGQLVNERLAAETFAACRSGDPARARRAAALFLARDATSALASRVRNTCAPEVR
jgi:hypothetical protein